MKHLIYWGIVVVLAAVSYCIINYEGFHSVSVKIAIAFWCGTMQSLGAFMAAEKIYGAYR
jgi:hypothetical protein